MNTAEKKLSREDKIFATLTCNGNDIANINGRNFSSTSEIMRKVVETSGKWIGIAILTIRNYNQGWKINIPVSFTPTIRISDRRASEPFHSAPRLDGKQYVLPFMP